MLRARIALMRIRWLATGVLAVCLLDMPCRADEKATTANPEREPMVEMEAQFVRATDTQMREALDEPGAQFTLFLSAERSEKVLAALRASKADFFSNPQAITDNGGRTMVEAVRELRYPVEFEPSKSNPGKVLPTRFETRKVGVTMEFEAVIGHDDVLGRLIEVVLAPSIVTFHGFIDYSNGKPGLNAAEPRALDELLMAPLKEGGVWQPIFSTQKLSASVVVPAGQSFVLKMHPPVRDPVEGKVPLPNEGEQKDLNTYIFVTLRLVGSE